MAKRSYLFVGVNLSGNVTYVKVKTFSDLAAQAAWLDFTRSTVNPETLHGFEWRLPNRQTKPFKVLLDGKFDKDVVLNLLTHVGAK